MGTLSRLREELEELTGELEDASAVPDAARLPEISRAHSAIVEARDALSSAFLSRRSLILARESIARAQVAVSAALAISHDLRTRAASLKSDAAEIRSVAAGLKARLGDRSYGRDSSSAAGTVEIESGIPGEHPHKREIEAALAQALAGAGGRWKAWITVPAGGTWWGLRIKGPGIEWVETLQGVNDQTPEAIVACVEPLVALVSAEALYAAKVGRRALLARRESETG